MTKTMPKVIFLFWHCFVKKFYGENSFYHSSKESSASTYICIFPSRYSLAYSSGSSIAKAFKAHSEQGVVCNPFSASQQPILRCYPAEVAMSMLLWFMLYSAYIIFIVAALSLKYCEEVKGVRYIIVIQLAACYNFNIIDSGKPIFRRINLLWKQ